MLDFDNQFVKELGSGLGAYSFIPRKQTNYAEMYGSTIEMGNQLTGNVSNGAFRYQVCRATRDFTDGTSNTVCVAEFIPMYPTKRDWPGCGTNSYEPIHSWMWTLGTTSYGSIINAMATPNSILDDCMSSTGTTGATPVTGRCSARSYHVGGVRALLTDGGVRFVSNNIDLGIWKALATIAGGETIGEY